MSDNELTEEPWDHTLYPVDIPKSKPVYRAGPKSELPELLNTQVIASRDPRLSPTVPSSSVYSREFPYEGDWSDGGGDDSESFHSEDWYCQDVGESFEEEAKNLKVRIHINPKFFPNLNSSAELESRPNEAGEEVTRIGESRLTSRRSDESRKVSYQGEMPGWMKEYLEESQAAKLEPNKTDQGQSKNEEKVFTAKELSNAKDAKQRTHVASRSSESTTREDHEDKHSRDRLKDKAITRAEARGDSQSDKASSVTAKVKPGVDEGKKPKTTSSTSSDKDQSSKAKPYSDQAWLEATQEFLEETKKSKSNTTQSKVSTPKEGYCTDAKKKTRNKSGSRRYPARETVPSSEKTSKEGVTQPSKTTGTPEAEENLSTAKSPFVSKQLSHEKDEEDIVLDPRVPDMYRAEMIQEERRRKRQAKLEAARSSSETTPSHHDDSEPAPKKAAVDKPRKSDETVSSGGHKKLDGDQHKSRPEAVFKNILKQDVTGKLNDNKQSGSNKQDSTVKTKSDSSNVPMPKDASRDPDKESKRRPATNIPSQDSTVGKMGVKDEHIKEKRSMKSHSPKRDIHEEEKPIKPKSADLKQTEKFGGQETLKTARHDVRDAAPTRAVAAVPIPMEPRPERRQGREFSSPPVEVERDIPRTEKEVVRRPESNIQPRHKRFHEEQDDQWLPLRSKNDRSREETKTVRVEYHKPLEDDRLTDVSYAHNSEMTWRRPNEQYRGNQYSKRLDHPPRKIFKPLSKYMTKVLADQCRRGNNRDVDLLVTREGNRMAANLDNMCKGHKPMMEDDMPYKHFPPLSLNTELESTFIESPTVKRIYLQELKEWMTKKPLEFYMVGRLSLDDKKPGDIPSSIKTDQTLRECAELYKDEVYTLLKGDSAKPDAQNVFPAPRNDTEETTHQVFRQVTKYMDFLASKSFLVDQEQQTNGSHRLERTENKVASEGLPQGVSARPRAALDDRTNDRSIIRSHHGSNPQSPTLGQGGNLHRPAKFPESTMNMAVGHMDKRQFGTSSDFRPLLNAQVGQPLERSNVPSARPGFLDRMEAIMSETGNTNALPITRNIPLEPESDNSTSNVNDNHVNRQTEQKYDDHTTKKPIPNTDKPPRMSEVRGIVPTHSGTNPQERSYQEEKKRQVISLKNDDKPAASSAMMYSPTQPTAPEEAMEHEALQAWREQQHKPSETETSKKRKSKDSEPGTGKKKRKDKAKQSDDKKEEKRKKDKKDKKKEKKGKGKGRHKDDSDMSDEGEKSKKHSDNSQKQHRKSDDRRSISESKDKKASRGQDLSLEHRSSARSEHKEKRPDNPEKMPSAKTNRGNIILSEDVETVSSAQETKSSIAMAPVQQDPEKMSEIFLEYFSKFNYDIFSQMKDKERDVEKFDDHIQVPENHFLWALVLAYYERQKEEMMAGIPDDFAQSTSGEVKNQQMTESSQQPDNINVHTSGMSLTSTGEYGSIPSEYGTPLEGATVEMNEYGSMELKLSVPEGGESELTTEDAKAEELDAGKGKKKGSSRLLQAFRQQVEAKKRAHSIGEDKQKHLEKLSADRAAKKPAPKSAKPLFLPPTFAKPGDGTEIGEQMLAAQKLGINLLNPQETDRVFRQAFDTFAEKACALLRQKLNREFLEELAKRAQTLLADSSAQLKHLDSLCGIALSIYRQLQEAGHGVPVQGSKSKPSSKHLKEKSTKKPEQTGEEKKARTQSDSWKEVQKLEESDATHLEDKSKITKDIMDGHERLDFDKDKSSKDLSRLRKIGRPSYLFSARIEKLVAEEKGKDQSTEIQIVEGPDPATMVTQETTETVVNPTQVICIPDLTQPLVETEKHPTEQQASTVVSETAAMPEDISPTTEVMETDEDKTKKVSLSLPKGNKLMMAFRQAMLAKKRAQQKEGLTSASNKHAGKIVHQFGVKPKASQSASEALGQDIEPPKIEPVFVTNTQTASTTTTTLSIASIGTTAVTSALPSQPGPQPTFTFPQSLKDSQILTRKPEDTPPVHVEPIKQMSTPVVVQPTPVVQKPPTRSETSSRWGPVVSQVASLPPPTVVLEPTLVSVPLPPVPEPEPIPPPPPEDTTEGPALLPTPPRAVISAPPMMAVPPPIPQPEPNVPSNPPAHLASITTPPQSAPPLPSIISAPPVMTQPPPIPSQIAPEAECSPALLPTPPPSAMAHPPALAVPPHNPVAAPGLLPTPSSTPVPGTSSGMRSTPSSRPALLPTPGTPEAMMAAHYSSMQSQSYTSSQQPVYQPPPMYPQPPPFGGYPPVEPNTTQPPPANAAPSSGDKTEKKTGELSTIPLPPPGEPDVDSNLDKSVYDPSIMAQYQKKVQEFLHQKQTGAPPPGPPPPGYGNSYNNWNQYYQNSGQGSSDQWQQWHNYWNSMPNRYPPPPPNWGSSWGGDYAQQWHSWNQWNQGNQPPTGGGPPPPFSMPPPAGGPPPINMPPPGYQAPEVSTSATVSVDEVTDKSAPPSAGVPVKPPVIAGDLRIYVHNTERECCQQVQHFLTSIGAKTFDTNNAKLVGLTQFPPLRYLVLVHSDDLSSIHHLPNLHQLRQEHKVQFATFTKAEEVMARKQQPILHSGGLLIPDDISIIQLRPSSLESLLDFLVAEKKADRHWMLMIHKHLFAQIDELRASCSETSIDHQRLIDLTQLLVRYEDKGVVKTLAEHECAGKVRPAEDYLQCCVRIQAQHCQKHRQCYFLSDMSQGHTARGIFNCHGIGVMSVSCFLENVANKLPAEVMSVPVPDYGHRESPLYRDSGLSGCVKTISVNLPPATILLEALTSSTGGSTLEPGPPGVETLGTGPASTAHLVAAGTLPEELDEIEEVDMDVS